MISKFTGVLTPLLTGPYPSYDLLTYEDDTAHDQWYVVLALPFVDKNLIKYTGVNGKISSQWLMDPVISYGDIEAMFTFEAPTGDVRVYVPKVSQFKLPGIGTSAKYGISDIEAAVNKLCGVSSPPYKRTNMGIFGEFESDLMLDTDKEPDYVCDCGGHALGYKDTDLHGHGQWCKALKVYGGQKN